MNKVKSEILREGAAMSAKILLVDTSGSVLGIPAKLEGEATFRNYTAYGYGGLRGLALLQMGFNGEFREAASLYLLGNGFRAYSVTLERFYSPDSWSPFGKGGLNAYCYCFGDPLNNADPSGHMNVAKLIFKRAFRMKPQSSTKLWLQMDSPAYTRARGAMDAPPAYGAHYSTHAAPPSYSPRYSREVPRNHTSIEVIGRAKIPEAGAPPRYPDVGQRRIREASASDLPSTQLHVYSQRLERLLIEQRGLVQRGRSPASRSVVRMSLVNSEINRIRDLMGRR